MYLLTLTIQGKIMKQNIKRFFRVRHTDFGLVMEPRWPFQVLDKLEREKRERQRRRR